MYESITVLEERLLALNDLLDSKICKEDTDFKTWIEKEQLPKLMLEYMGRPGCNIDLLKEKKMNLAELARQPLETQAEITVQVGPKFLRNGTAKTGNLWNVFTVTDASINPTDAPEIFCFGALQLNQVLAIKMQWKPSTDPKYPNPDLSGTVVEDKTQTSSASPSSAAPSAAASPPATTSADKQSYSAVAGTPTTPAAANQSKFHIDDVRKSTIANCAGMIVEKLIVAGILKPDTAPGNSVEDNIREWANYLYNVAKGIGKSDVVNPAVSSTVQVPDSEIPF